MYSKDELMSKGIDDLRNIAQELNADIKDFDNIELVAYAILDKQAETTSSAPTPRKRTRITKVDSDKVYSVKGAEGENFDTPKRKKKAAVKEKPLFNEDLFMRPEKEEAVMNDEAADMNTQETTEQEVVEQPQNAAAMTPEEELAAMPKHRGRKTKRELELLAIIEQQQNNIAEEPQEEAEEPQVENATQVTEEPAEAELDPVWEGDPADGTDFIVVVDVPGESQVYIPSFDDNMPAANNEPRAAAKVQKAQKAQKADYDFNDIIEANGVLEVMSDSFGFLRSSDYNYLPSPDDVYIPQNVVKRAGLKTGDVIECKVRPPQDGDKYFTITSLERINGRDPKEVRDRMPFEHLTPLFPEEKFTLCGDPATTNPSTRIVDLFSPIGKGQRALIVAQPKTGKTILMKDIANAIAANHPEAYLMMLLIDERPEEVTDMARTVNAEVIASTFDEPADHHVKIAGIVLEKAKRLVECGHDVVIFLDSITRLARAYNTVAPASGKVLTGGVDANALQKPKRFFGAARNIEGGGSLTIIATALIDTGSKMDEVIFEEFKGTGNMELQLDRSLSNKRVFPAVNLVASSTRRDDLLHDDNTLSKMWILRKFIADMTAMEAMELVHKGIEQTRNNEEFFNAMNE